MPCLLLLLAMLLLLGEYWIGLFVFEIINASEILDCYIVCAILYHIQKRSDKVRDH